MQCRPQRTGSQAWQMVDKRWRTVEKTCEWVYVWDMSPTSLARRGIGSEHLFACPFSPIPIRIRYYGYFPIQTTITESTQSGIFIFHLFLKCSRQRTPNFTELFASCPATCAQVTFRKCLVRPRIQYAFSSLGHIVAGNDVFLINAESCFVQCLGTRRQACQDHERTSHWCTPVTCR